MPDQEQQLAVEIVFIDLPVSRYFYALPSQWSGAGPGWAAAVQLKNRKTLGWVTRVLPLTEATAIANADAGKVKKQQQLLSVGRGLKPVLDVVQAYPPELFPLFEWISNYYGTPLVEVLETAVPLPAKISSELGVVRLKKKRKSATPATKDHGADSAFAAEAPEVLTEHQESAIGSISQALAAQEFRPFLLHGITGSGKTEVYIRAIQDALQRGGSALLIVPEIALTPQLVGRLHARLGDRLGVLHSGIGAAERWRTWREIMSGEVRVVIGARSAVFAPLQNLSLIVVDEEHEGSYKQSDGLRYHGRDIAVMRGKLCNAPVVLGSATPSFESLLNAAQKRYSLLELPKRATVRSLPTVEIVDLTKIKKREMASPSISPQLHALLRERLSNGEQSVLLYNRRGFASFLQCGSCGAVTTCPHCSVSLTFHKSRNRVVCHYCDYTASPAPYCSTCRDPRTVQSDDGEFDPEFGVLEHRGSGTERIVEEIKALLPTARILQMDRDTTSTKDSTEEILSAMRTGAADILIGTQMIAKGHDLPGVTLVGIIDADVGLHMPDFRSSERTFQLITQASGRAGRGERPGRVVVQTREINHPTIIAIATGRFKAFARYELDYRKKLRYPPYGKLMRVVVSGMNLQDTRDAVMQTAQLIKRRAQELDPEGLTVLGPAPAPIEKIRGRVRFHLLLKSPSAKVLSQLARELYEWKFVLQGRVQEKKEGATDDGREFRLTIDVDPQEML